MSNARNITSLILLVALAISFFSESINKALGRVEIQKSQLLRWENTTSLNNDCKVDHSANACEDVKFHFASNTAFLACGDPEGRTSWYPGAGRHNAKRRKDFREKLFKYDVKSGKTTELRIEGLEGDLVTHGLDVFDVPGDVSKVSGFDRTRTK
jgi:arylesterase/paraoxonase